MAMIENFRHKGLKRLYEKADRSGLNAQMIPRIEEIMAMLDAAETVQELDIPGYRLHPLAGDLKGFWSIRVTGNWRIVFRFANGAASDIDLTDYH
jgi:proteic killer suppression protein